MAAEQLERRLAAILAADVVGYSRLMGVDEAGTHARLKALATSWSIRDRRAPRPRVKRTGDGALVEFASVVDAVHARSRSSASMPRATRRRADRRIEFRIGINLGDYLRRAATSSATASTSPRGSRVWRRPGGVCVARRRPSDDPRPARPRLRGPWRAAVKNIARPVRRMASLDRGAARPRPPPHRRRLPCTPLPDKPSIAVLPFDNLSARPGTGVFQRRPDRGPDHRPVAALGLVRHVAPRDVPVKGRPAPPRQVATDLGVRYVLEGSVRRAANRVRINAQLIDAATGFHLWAQRYDRDLDDIFALQDEITRAIVAALEVHLTPRERATSSAATRTTSRPTTCSCRRAETYRRKTKERTEHARDLFRRATRD